MSALIDLPGSSADPGTGPVVIELVESILDDAADPPAPRTAWYADLLGPVLVEAAAVETFAATLPGSTLALPVLLSATDRQQLRAARDLLVEDPRVDLVGVRIPVGADAGGVQTGPATHALLGALDFSMPSWLMVRPTDGWDAVLDVVAADGAEQLTLVLDGARAEQDAALLRSVVDHDLAFRVGGAHLTPLTLPGAQAAPGWLNVVCAVRAALNGAETDSLATILTCTDPAPLSSALRRMSEADAALTRAFLAGVEVHDTAATVEQLVEFGLVDADSVGTF